jgi:hypothetical protein
MKLNELIPAVPFVWPEARILEGIAAYRYEVPFHELAMQSKGIFGVVSCINERGVDWFRYLVDSNEELDIRIVLAVYGACGTESEHLEQLLEIQQQYPGRIEFCIYTTDISFHKGAPTNLLCCLGKNGHFVQIGPATNFGLSGTLDVQMNLVFKAEASLINEMRKWFDYLWHRPRTPGLSDT